MEPVRRVLHNKVGLMWWYRAHLLHSGIKCMLLLRHWCLHHIWQGLRFVGCGIVMHQVQLVDVLFVYTISVDSAHVVTMPSIWVSYCCIIHLISSARPVPTETTGLQAAFFEALCQEINPSEKSILACFPPDSGMDDSCFKIPYDVLVLGKRLTYYLP